jgi:hypothetical protein
MNPNHETMRIITNWVLTLADVCAHGDGKPSKNVIAAYASVLGQSFPSAAFTAQSLAHVTHGRKWFPAVGEIGPLMAEWWQGHKPASAPMLTDGRGQPDGWEDMDQHWVNFWNKRHTEISKLQPRKADFERDRLASLIRQRSPLAALFLGLTSPPPTKLTPERCDAIVRSVRQQSAMPPVPHAIAGFSVEMPRKALADVTLTPEQLLEARRRNGVLTVPDSLLGPEKVAPVVPHRSSANREEAVIGRQGGEAADDFKIGADTSPPRVSRPNVVAFPRPPTPTTPEETTAQQTKPDNEQIDAPSWQTDDASWDCVSRSFAGEPA